MADQTNPAIPTAQGRRVVRRHPVRVLVRFPPRTQYYDEEFEVEALVAHRWLPDATLQFLVKWVGFPSSANTWQSKEDLANAPVRLREYKEAQGLP